MNDSGNATRRAPLRPASTINSQALSIVASRFKNTGAACTAATLKRVVGIGTSAPPLARDIVLLNADDRQLLCCSDADNQFQGKFPADRPAPLRVGGTAHSRR